MIDQIHLENNRIEDDSSDERLSDSSSIDNDFNDHCSLLYSTTKIIKQEGTHFAFPWSKGCYKRSFLLNKNNDYSSKQSSDPVNLIWSEFFLNSFFFWTRLFWICRKNDQLCIDHGS